MHSLKSIAVAVALLASVSQVSAKITFNDVRRACLPSITEFLGQTGWANHAYRATSLVATDFGRTLVRTVSVPFPAGVVTMGSFTYVPYRHVEASVRIDRLNYEQGVSFSYEADAFLTIGNGAVRETRLRFQRLLAFAARRDTDAPIWYVFRPMPANAAVADTMLYTVNGLGMCEEAAFYPVSLKDSPLLMVRQ